ncbi:hypothetical protein J6590_011573 [Homalodisca vitripennis]|nr:hypothetical protein J6590_011573 [Homalodisca vitripennis]
MAGGPCFYWSVHSPAFSHPSADGDRPFYVQEEVTSEPPPMAGQVDCLHGQDRSAVNYPSSNHARRCLIWLSCDKCSRYTAPLAEGVYSSSKQQES